MALNLWETGTANAFQTTLNGSISGSDNTITLTSVAGLVAPGILVIDRLNSLNQATPNQREYISVTGISVNTLTGVTRGVAGSSAQSHLSAAVVEEVFSTTHWGDFLDVFEVGHNTDGTHKPLSTVTVTGLTVTGFINASGVSVSGINPVNPVWVINAAASSVSQYASYPLTMPTGGTFSWFSVTLNSFASGASYIFDINKNGSSVFNSGTRIAVAGGGTYASTASIATRTFSAGDTFWVDIDGMGANPLVATIQGRGS